jgi:hypothetical protein
MAASHPEPTTTAGTKRQISSTSIPARASAKSVARFPERFDGPTTRAASVIGVALDLIAELTAPAPAGGQGACSGGRWPM